jgi:type II secretory pathway predicted ATPase ExeA
MSYCQFFGFKAEPFTHEIATQHLLKLPSGMDVKGRLEYVIGCGGVFLITGDVGSGKTTAIRWAQNQFHSSQYLFVNVIASGGSFVEFYRQLCWGLDMELMSGSRTALLKKFKTAVMDISTTKKQKIIITVDEAHLLRPEIFAELHTITQFENDSRNIFSIVLAGQTNLIDKLTYRTSEALASRVIARIHLAQLTEKQVEQYLVHRLHVVGIKTQLFSPQAIVAIYQGSAGILRRVNDLARGGLVAAASEKQNVVSSEHIRIASTELL